jgi:uncharacterized protein
LALLRVASAASFDCARAKAPREQLICREPVLSDLDDKLGRAYQERRALLSPRGAELLERSESSWLHFLAIVCPMEVPADADRSSTPKKCLEEKYNERLGQLAKVGQRLGPFLFNRIDLYAAEPAPDSSGNMRGFYAQHVAYPQIDNSDLPLAAAWNKQAVKSLSKSDDCGTGDDDLDYDIGYATERVISVEWTSFVYCHGTPHGFFTINAENTVLYPGLRALTPEDLFGKDGRWAQKIQEIFWNALVAKGWSPPEDQSESVKHEIEDEVIRPDKWLLTKEGLQVSFSAYEGGCYVCNPGTVEVPWARLQPLLSPSAIVP